MQCYWLLLGSLGVWRLTHLVSSEDGPGRIFSRLRERLAGKLWGDLAMCFYCLSVWIAFPFAVWIASGWHERILLWPALSGAAILLERATEGRSAEPVTFYTEDREEELDVLRKKERAGAG